MAKIEKIGRSGLFGNFVTADSARHPKAAVVATVHPSKGAGKTPSSGVDVRDSKTGKFVNVKGVGALKDSKFTIQKSVDLTKPIAKQALRGKAKLAG